MEMPQTITHIAGPYHRFGDTVRQRCSWCGALLVTYDAEMSELKTWATGTIVSMSEGAVWQVAGWHADQRDACFNDRRVKGEDFDRYCVENMIPLGKEPEAFEDWIAEKRWAL